MTKLKYITISVILLLLLSVARPSLNVSAGPLAVTSPGLGAADSFAVLSGALTSNVPGSSITGNVGVDPIGGASITGLTCAEVTGTIYDNDGGYTGNGGGSTACRVTDAGLLTSAKNDLVTAYDGLAALDNATCTSIPSELGGQSLVAGVYCAGTFTLTGILNLQGAGVWIFRSADTIITAPGSSVTGGDPCNVWWRSESSVTLDSTTSFIGNILALTSITMNTGASLTGRALARNGAVTLQQNTISRPICTAPTTVMEVLEEETTVTVRALPNTGGAPIRNDSFPWTLAIFGGVGAAALILGLRTYLRANKQ